MSYGLSYATPTGYHLNAIVTNPHNPQETVRIDYGKLESKTGRNGSAAVAQDFGAATNSGVTYHVWDDDDTPLYYFPNQKGVILEEQAGGDTRLMDPNTRNDAQMVKSGVQLKGHHLEVFHALNDEVEGGEHILGVSHHKEVALGDHFSAELGSALYTSSSNSVKRDQRDSNGTGIVRSETMNTYGLYLRGAIKGSFKLTDRLNLSSQFLLRATTYFSDHNQTEQGYMLNASTGAPTNRGEVSFLADGSGSLITDLSLQHGRNSKSNLQVDLSGQVSDISATSGFKLYLRRLTLGHEESFDVRHGMIDVGSSLNVIPLNTGVMPAILSTKVGYRTNDRSQQYSLGFTGALNPESTPGFIAGGRPTFTGEASFSADLGTPVTFGLSATYGPELNFTGSRPVDQLDQSGSDLVDYYNYNQGSEPTQRFDHASGSPVTPAQGDYNLRIPHDYSIKFFLKSRF